MPLPQHNDEDIYPWMQENVKLHQPRLIEIGAHHAQDSERFIRMFIAPVIVAFEPDPRNTPVIEARRLPHFTLVPAAVGNQVGMVEFHLSGGFQKYGHEWSFSSSCRRPKNHLHAFPHVKFVDTVQVPIVTLDHWYSHVPQPVEPIDFIWCDVQGNEGDVIRGGMQVLRHTRYFYTEYANDEMYEGQVNLAELCELLHDDFEPIGLFSCNVLFRNTTMC